jgi:hypothetical protein
MRSNLTIITFGALYRSMFISFGAVHLVWCHPRFVHECLLWIIGATHPLISLR